MRLILTAFALLFSIVINAQAPALIPYQAIARDESGQPLANSTLNARFTLHNGSASGASVWQEQRTVTTSALGLFTVQLGSNAPLTAVNWGNGAKFMQVEIDLGNGFIDMGSQQLLSVPYALHAANVNLNVSATGDSLFVGENNFVVIPGISEVNSNLNGGGTTTGTTLHTCGAANVHNPDLTYGTMTDQQGNTYKTIVIGTQEWMAENLNTSIYRNGDAIPTNLDDAAWENTTSGAWAYYNNDASYACPYGKLYNWYACVDARELCPLGWHVPSDEEWTVLTDYLGGESVAGGKMKSTGTIEATTGLWNAPNVDAINTSGFSWLPAGSRDYIGDYNYLGISSYVWKSTNLNSSFSYYSDIQNTTINTNSFSTYSSSGFSVRCLRD